VSAVAFDFALTAVVPASPQEVYDAWLDSRAHSAMTGGKARVSAKPGAAFTAWDGYISGRNVTLEPGRRIMQTWRTTKFAKADPDSEIEVLLAAVEGGTRLTLHHTNVPDGHTSYRDGGWQENYFAPMKEYFAER
jgi:activator of HSP90 ATPase